MEIQTAPVPGNPVVLVVGSFLTVVLIFGSYSRRVVAAEVTKGPISCAIIAAMLPVEHKVECCQTTTDSEGIEITTCTVCDDTEPPSNCDPPFQVHAGPNPTGVPNPLGNALPPSNNTGTLPPGSIIKVPVNHTNELPPNNNTAPPLPSPGNIEPLKCPPFCQPSPPTNTTGPVIVSHPLPSIHQHHKGSNHGPSTSTGSNSTAK